MYPFDRRSQVQRLYSLLLSYRKVAFVLNVSHTTVARWLKQVKRSPYPKRENTKSDQVKETLMALIQFDPFISLHKLKAKITEMTNVIVSKELLRLLIAKQKYTKKTAKFFSEPKDLKNKTELFIQSRDQHIDSHRSFVSIDETSFGRHGRVTKGYAPVGKKLVIKKKQSRITTTSCLVAMSDTKLIRIENVKGSYNTLLFLNFLKELNLAPYTVILLDNVRFHHAKVIKEWASENDIFLLYTPPYSPWFNPIEGIFSIAKRSFYQDMTISQSFLRVTENHIKAFMDKSLNIREMP